jgi:hypothetical protein
MYTSLLMTLIKKPEKYLALNVQFIQATDRGTHGFPESQQKTHLRKRLFTTGESLRTPSSTVIFGNVGLNLEKGWGWSISQSGPREVISLLVDPTVSHCDQPEADHGSFAH